MIHARAVLAGVRLTIVHLHARQKRIDGTAKLLRNADVRLHSPVHRPRAGAAKAVQS